MKICVFGAGAIGGYMGVKLAQAGADVSLVARGPHLAAMKDKGLTLIEEGADPVTVPVTASDNPADLGPQDYIIVTLKAHSVPPVVPKMQPLMGENTTISLGEPDGSKSDRAMALSKALGAAGLKAPVRPRLRDEIWVKLWGNLSFNPISALTHATLDVLCTDEGTRPVARNMMLEAQTIAEKLGVKFPIDVDRRIDGGAAVGAHRTSMLQDLEQGRPMEIDALVGSVQELGRVTDTPTPTIDTVLALVKLRARSAGLYGG